MMVMISIVVAKQQSITMNASLRDLSITKIFFPLGRFRKTSIFSIIISVHMINNILQPP